MRILHWLVGGAAIAGVASAAAPGLSAQQRPEVTVSGVGYFSYRYQLEADSSIGGEHGNNFDVDRAYLTVTAAGDHGLSARITTDIDPGRSNTNHLQLRLKYAYVAWQPTGSPFTFRFGATQTPLIAWLEALWDYRMQGTVALDRTGYLASSDFGVSASGSWQDGRINAMIGVYNGEGYNNRPGDAGKDIGARLSVRLSPGSTGGATGGLRLTGYAQLGSATGGGARRRLVGIISWQDPRLTLAAEYAVTRDSVSVLRPTAAGRVASIYGVYNWATAPVSLIGRVDRWNPDTDVAAETVTRVIAGVGYRFTPQFRLLLDTDLASLGHGSADIEGDASRRTLQLQAEFVF